MTRRRTGGLLRDDGGQAVAEFAVTLPIILLLLMGVVYFGKAYYIDQSARIAVRYAAWKASRHGEGDIGPAAGAARNYFVLTDGASIDGSKESNQLDELGLFTSDVLEGIGDPGSLPGEFNISGAIIDELISAGLATVDQSFHASLDESWTPELLSFMGGTSIQRDHYVLFGDWTKDDIHGDEIILAFEAALDAWAYDEITNM